MERKCKADGNFEEIDNSCVRIVKQDIGLVILYFAVIPLLSVSFITIVIRYYLRKKLNVKRYGTGNDAKLRKKIEKQKDKGDNAYREAERMEKALKENELEERMNNGFKTEIVSVV